MSAPKAIMIVLILFLIIAIVFVFLYLSQPPAVNQPIKQAADNRADNTPDQVELTPAQQATQAIEAQANQQVGQIVEQGQTSAGGLTAEAQRKIDEAVNQEIMEKIKLKTPEQLKADQARQAELDKLEQETNRQIRDQLPNK